MKFATAVLMVGMLAGCASSPPDNTLDYRPGDGVVQAVQAGRVALPDPGLVRPRWTEGYQLTLRMGDGSMQRVTQDSAAFKPGERVRITLRRARDEGGPDERGAGGRTGDGRLARP
jgi:hypothetical protein